MSGGKRKGTPAPDAPPVPRVRMLPQDGDAAAPAASPAPNPGPPRRAPLARKRRSRFVF